MEWKWPAVDNNQTSTDWTSGDDYGSWVLGDGSGENGENKWDLRLDPNVDKDGNPDEPDLVSTQKMVGVGSQDMLLMYPPVED